MTNLRKYLDFVRFEHTVFALPFALASMAVTARATHGWPGWRTFLLGFGLISQMGWPYYAGWTNH
jgi:4-hydroxybenzoate polyprenyltransferase